jgi:hypothetical protein
LTTLLLLAVVAVVQTQVAVAVQVAIEHPLGHQAAEHLPNQEFQLLLGQTTQSQ